MSEITSVWLDEMADFSEKDWKAIHIGTFVPSERDHQLYLRLQQYYDECKTRNEFVLVSKNFRDWRRERGYTNQEYNAMKRSFPYK